ncbi:MAG TPA: histidine kinase dimerization/phospho-acceptor domain-containing protein [Gemmatimonadales bacterium]|nr:histidine kinase dimerization/phospho-acceptor domain-containing protein [Gemmatimonadales bacterium]
MTAPAPLEDQVRRLRHDLANPLAAVLAEVQLLLLNTERYDEETLTALREIEKLARRMRDLLQQQVPPPQP